jgi:TatD DNase family protein
MSLNLKETISRANKDGVEYLLTISTTDKSLKKILKITSDFNCVYGTYGIHPHEVKNHLNCNSKDIISKINKSKKIIGIGETGLDFYYNHSEKTAQIESFKQHIFAAQETKKTLIVHTRSAEEETLKILKEEKKKKDKLKTILAICESNKKVDWVNAPTYVISDIFDEFDYITKLLKEVIDE